MAGCDASAWLPMPFCLEKALYLFSEFAGRHNGGDVIARTQRAVNTSHPSIQHDRTLIMASATPATLVPGGASPHHCTTPPTSVARSITHGALHWHFLPHSSRRLCYDGVAHGREG